VRIGLGKVLLKDPDLLCLDEPTNHLDLESVQWLESFLRQNELPMVVVSHDREFLDRLCTKIVELEAGEAFEYSGNYITFLKLQAERRKVWQAAYERQQKYLSEQRSFIRRYRSSPARAKQVKSRQKLLERMEKDGEVVRIRADHPPPRPPPIPHQSRPPPTATAAHIASEPTTPHRHRRPYRIRADHPPPPSPPIPPSLCT